MESHVGATGSLGPVGIVFLLLLFKVERSRGTDISSRSHELKTHVPLVHGISLAILSVSFQGTAAIFTSESPSVGSYYLTAYYYYVTPSF